MSDPKKERVNILEKNMVDDFTLMKTRVTLLELSLQRQQMQEKRWRKLKKLINRLLEKFKF